MKKAKLYNLLLILSSLLVYLEWGESNSMLLLTGEIDVLKKMFTEPLSVMHPFIILPLAGQILLAITLFQKKPNKYLSIIGVIGLNILVLFILFIGLISQSPKIAGSTLPCILISALILINLKKHLEQYR